MWLEGVSKEESGRRYSPRSRQRLDCAGLCISRGEEFGFCSAWNDKPWEHLQQSSDML